ncbi:piggyBac transposable element-derived protein 4-like [Myzus persicae]|uniref:piggyBac transposable element-derived protein 4-like n=1 Tax=Myzus persicae TaxID=13164 RepID=UPI000B937C4B|nr:piggyBac transposable element-derived protein 4-like [Myzus persicae]
MSYKRFLFLCRCLRFDDRETRAERRVIDKLAPIRTTFDLFLKNINQNYNLSEYTTIDEMLHPFRGRCQWIQYIPSKPAKYGIKMFALCDAKTFYTSKIEIYVGKQPPGTYEVSNSPIDIVKRLVTPIENSKRNLTTDNWYTKFLPDKKKEVGSSVFGFQKNKTLVSYVPRKNKAVILLSTMHHDSKIDVETRKPEIIMDYNCTKDGVDTVDKMCAAYSVSRITKRWPLVIFYSLMNIAGINAQVLFSYYKHNNAPKIRRLFLKTLAFDLMKEHLASRAQISSLPSDISSFLKIKYAVPNSVEVFNRQQLSNNLKRKAVEELYDKPSKLIHGALSNDIPTLTTYDLTLIQFIIEKVLSTMALLEGKTRIFSTNSDNCLKTKVPPASWCV